MKKTKLFSLGVMIAMAVALPSCGGSSTENSTENSTSQETTEESPAMRNLRKQVEELNKTMPVAMQGGLKMTKAALENGYLVFTCEYPSTIEFTIPEDEATKASIIGGLPRPTLRMLKQSELGLKYIYVQDDGAKTRTLVITPEEIKK